MELGHKQIPGYCQVNGMAQSPSQLFFGMSHPKIPLRRRLGMALLGLTNGLS